MPRERAVFIIEAVDKATGTIRQVRKELQGLEKSTQKTTQAAQKGTGAFGGLMAVFGKLTAAFVAAEGAIWALKRGYDALLRAPVRAAAEAEQYEAQLRAVARSAEEARQAYQTVIEFARTTPFETKGVAESATLLAAYGIELQKLPEFLQALGDAAGAFGRDIKEATIAFLAGVSGESEPLKRWGITMRQRGDEVTFIWKDKMGNLRQITAENTRDMRAQILRAIFNEKYAGGMKQLEGTWRGTMMVLRSVVWELQAKIGETMTKAPGMRRGFQALSRLIMSIPKLFQTFAPALREFFNVVGDWVSAWASALQNLVLPALQGIFTFISSALQPVFRAMSESARRFALLFQAVAKVLRERLGAAADKLLQAFRNLGKLVGGAVAKAFQFMLNLVLRGLEGVLRMTANLLMGYAEFNRVLVSVCETLTTFLARFRPLLEATAAWNPAARAALAALDKMEGTLEGLAARAEVASRGARGIADTLYAVADAVSEVRSADLSGVMEELSEATQQQQENWRQTQEATRGAAEAQRELNERLREIPPLVDTASLTIQKVNLNLNEQMTYALQVAQAVGQQLKSAFDSLVDALVEGRLSFQQWAAESVKAIMKVVVKMMLLKALKAALGPSGIALFGFERGGPVLAFQTGGPVPGIGLSDRVPAVLTPGEFVLRREAVQSLGRTFLEALNRGQKSVGGTVNISVSVQGGSSAAEVAEAVRQTIIDIVREEKRMGRWPV